MPENNLPPGRQAIEVKTLQNRSTRHSIIWIGVIIAGLLIGLGLVREISIVTLIGIVLLPLSILIGLRGYASPEHGHH